MSLENPKNEEVLSKYSHLKGVKINDVVLGASEYTIIMTKTPPRVGQPGQPGAEKTLMG